MNVILGLCHSYSGKVVTFQESLFACKRKLSKLLVKCMLYVQSSKLDSTFMNVQGVFLSFSIAEFGWEMRI